jgi:MFS family permease
MVRLQARLSAKQGRPRAAAIACALDKNEKTVTMDNASDGHARPVAGGPLPSSSISFGMTLVLAIACGVAAANIYHNQPMLGIMEAAFPSQATVIGLVPTATQLGFAIGLLLLVPLGDRFDRRRLILIQFAALALLLAAAALAPDAWSLVVASALVGGSSSVAQQIVPFAAELAEPSRRGAIRKARGSAGRTRTPMAC